MPKTIGRDLRFTPQLFEASIFGFPIGRLELQGDEDTSVVVKALEEHPARLVTCRINADDERAADILRGVGFVEIERLVTFERNIEPISAMPSSIIVGDARTANICADIARRAFQYDRFHADPSIPSALADELKATWARNNALGRASLCLLALCDGSVVGFNQCRMVGDVAVIDLIAVFPEAQGRGLGRALVDASLASYGGRARRLRVGTQVANLSSVALYRAIGMTAVAEVRTFHRWAP